MCVVAERRRLLLNLFCLVLLTCTLGSCYSEGPGDVFYAISNGKNLRLKMFLEEGKIGANYQYSSEKPYRGEALLHVAARVGNLGAMEILAEYGADLNVQDVGDFGNTPLMWLVNYHPSNGIGGQNYYDCFEFLLKNGADIQVVNNKGETVIDYVNQFTNVDSPYRGILKKHSDFKYEK